MKKVSLAVFAIGLTSTVFLAAQSGTPSPNSGTTRPVQGAEFKGGQVDMMTVTGCLQRSESNAAANPAAQPTTTATQATRTGGSFILTDAKPSAVAAAMPPGATPSTAAGSPAASGTAGSAGTGPGRNYTLIEQNTGELGPHLGHLMQITGVIAGPNAGSSGDGANASATGSPNSATGGARSGAASMAANPRLEVFSIRMVAATCPPAPPAQR